MSLARRYAAKIAASLIGMVAGMLSMALVSRTLGPEQYGRFEFLNGFFQRVAAFLDTGTSLCFFTRLSQRPGDRGLVRFYVRLVAFVSVLLVAGTAIVAVSSFGKGLWAGEPMNFVLLGAALGCLTWWQQVARKAVDAYALTVQGELLGLANKLVATLALVLMVYGGWLSLGSYFAFQNITLATGGALFIWIAWKKKGVATTQEERSSKDYAREFWDYSHPLFAYALIGMLVGVLERWLLQTQSGAAQQGFFGLASQVSAVCFMFTGAMTQLLTREFAIAWESADRDQMGRLFSRYIPMFYTLATYISVFVAFHAADVTWLIGGNRFATGVEAVAVMALYPMHQTYGQLSGAVFYATGQTRLYRNIGIFGMIAGLPLLYWLVVPTTFWVRGLGAFGLGLKLVVMQVLIVNVQLWFNARTLALNFSWYVFHQIVVFVILATCAWASAAIVGVLALAKFPEFLLNGLTYSLLGLGVIVVFPRLLGISRDELRVWSRAAIEYRAAR